MAFPAVCPHSAPRFSTEDMQTTLSPCLTTYIFPPSTCWDSAMVPISAGDRMQIPGAAENAHLYQRQRLTGRAAHAAAPCRPNAAQHFKSPGESPAACFKMQLLFCLCVLRVLCGLCTVHPESFPCHFRRIFSVSATSVSFVPTKKGNAISGQFSPGFRQNKKRSLTFLPG